MPRPIRTTFTIPYGAQFGAPRANGTRTHQGTDYHCPIGTPIYATGSGGRVTGIFYSASGYGHYVTISWPSGRSTLDGHMRERSPLFVGQIVDTTTLVGYVGLTGNAVYADPPGAHDHHEVRINGALIDPESFYGTQPAGSTGTEIEDDMTDAQYNQLRADIGNAIKTSRINRPIKLFTVNGSDVQYAIGTNGQHWAVPEPAYLTLLDRFGLVAPELVQSVTADEFQFAKDLNKLLFDDSVNVKAAEVFTLSPESIAAIEVHLADDFDAVNANIDDQPTEFTITPKP